ncbi:hypothetical protein C0584_04690 [Candidatus Parcubacteria bacterium]|nr:MAG: hypothetical protein C0584_04690 [Candidatus Parcubacteria bacterium]
MSKYHKALLTTNLSSSDLQKTLLKNIPVKDPCCPFRFSNEGDGRILLIDQETEPVSSHLLRIHKGGVYSDLPYSTFILFLLALRANTPCSLTVHEFESREAFEKTLD